MKIINGETYSRKEFKNYNFRFIVELYTEGGIRPTSITIYTTEKSKDTIHNVFSGLVTEKVVNYNIIHFATKAQDELATKLIDSWLK